MKVDRKYLIETILEVMQETPYRLPSIGRDDISDRLQRSEMQRYLKIARTQGRSDIVEALKELIEALDNLQLPEDEYREYMAAIKDELEQPEKEKEPSRTSCRNKTIKEALAEIQYATQKAADKELQKRVGVTVRDEIGMFGWGSILKVLSGIGLATLGLPGGSAMVQFVDFVWNSSPRILEDLLTRPEASWGKQNVIDQFPVLDKLNINEKIYKLIAPEAIGIIAKNYIAEIQAMVEEDPSACVEEMPDVDDYYVDWLKANPEFNQLMKRGGKRKYRRSFTLSEADEQEFQKLMDLATDESEGSGIQALEMYEFFDLTEKQIKTLYNIVLFNALKHNVEDLPQVLEMIPPEYSEQEMEVHREMAVKVIIEKAETPELLLKEIGFDFHNEFTQVYGVTPPRDQEFVFEDDDIKLEVDLPGERQLIFTFWFAATNKDHPSDPWILMVNDEGETISIESPRSNVFYALITGVMGSSTEGQISKEDVPKQIKKHTGWSESGSINEVLHENEDDDGDSDFLEKLFSLVASGNLEQAFNLADSLGMEKELFERIVNDENNNELEYGLTKEIPDEATVEMVEFAIKHPALEDRYKEFFSNAEFTIPTSYNSNKKSWDTVTDFEIYRRGALLVFKNILKRYDQFNELNEENFGRESRGEKLLQEGWKDQIPPRFREFIDEIDNAALEEKRPGQVLSNYFFKLIKLNKTRANSLYNWFMWRLGSETRKAIKGYETALSQLDSNNPDMQPAYNDIEVVLKKAKAFNDWIVSEDTRKQMFQHHTDAEKLEQAGDHLGMLRHANKVLKSATKQAKRWLEKNWPESADFLLQKATETLTAETRKAQDGDLQSFYEGLTNKTWASLTRAVHKPDNLGPLETFYKKNKDLPRNEFMDEIEDYLDELIFPVEKKPCSSVGSEACTLLTLPNGMFWYNTGADQCSISANKMNNCGQASRGDSVLINLMSDKAGLKWHVMVEYNAPRNKIIQVLGKNNQIPNKKYWESIKALIDKLDDVILDSDAFLHANAPEEEVQAFIDGIGISTKPRPAVETWEEMEKQIREGFYNETAMELEPYFSRRRVRFEAAGVDERVIPKVALLELGIFGRQAYFGDRNVKAAREYIENYGKKDFSKLKELAEDTEFRKEAYDILIPEKFQNLIKFSNIRRVRAKSISTGTYVFAMKIEFELPIAGWTKEKGEMYAEGFVDLSNEIMDNVPNWMVQMGFMVAPERYAKAFPEEAKRQGMIDDIMRDMPLEEGKKKMKLDRNYLTSLILEVMNEESSSGKFSTVENANQTLNLYIDAGMLPEPVKMEVNEQWGSIYIKFNSNEELQQLIDILDEDGVTRQLGTSVQKPAYFVHKALVNKRKQFYRSDEEIPEPPPPTGLTLKF